MDNGLLFREMFSKFPQTRNMMMMLMMLMMMMMMSLFSQKFDSSRRVWLGLNFNPGSGLVWADGARVVAYPASSRLFVWESRRLLSVEVGWEVFASHFLSR